MENCWEEAPHGSQDYYPHYNLFQSSIFYDTDNFRVSYLSYRYDDCSPTESGTQCCEEQERSAEPPDKPVEAVTATAGASEPYIITKEELYKDPDLFRSRNEDVYVVNEIYTFCLFFEVLNLKVVSDMAHCIKVWLSLSWSFTC